MARREALNRLHSVLLARRAELYRRIGTELHDLGHFNESAGGGDSADAAFDTGNDEVSSRLAELEARELRQIERAMVRMKQGKYGLCEACQTRIPVARLDALPYSTLCVKCQREMESDANWSGHRFDGNWDHVSDGDHTFGDRGVDLSEIEIDLSK